LTTFTLGLYTSGQFHAQGLVLVLPLAVFYGGLVQMIAGFFAMAKGELFAAAFMTSYGAFWFSYVGVILFVVPMAGPAAHQAITIFLIMWTVITLIFTLATLGTNLVVLVTFMVFMVALILEVIGNATLTGAATANSLTKAGGYAEMVLAALAWYIVMAEIVNDTLEKPVFPLFPLRRTATPLEPQI
jgi:succinate-acetate transporter protein